MTTNNQESVKNALEDSKEELWILLNYKSILQWLSSGYKDTSKLLWVSSIEISVISIAQKKKNILKVLYQKIRKKFQRKKEKIWQLQNNLQD